MTDPAGVADTDDLRSSAPLHDSLLALLPLVGRWQGTGHGVAPISRAEFDYRQDVRFSHDGRPFLAYESRSWLIEVDPAPDADPAQARILRGAWRESGFWRVGAGQDDIEVVLASNTGEALVLTGTAGVTSWEVGSISVASAPTAKTVGGERRLYGLLAGQLVYATELAPAGAPYEPHLNARLRRL
ncbi:MAG: FABP family protein [Actinomycetota bacterium]|nr:FABP family protein [Actinomycetota bacterium]